MRDRRRLEEAAGAGAGVSRAEGDEGRRTVAQRTCWRAHAACAAVGAQRLAQRSGCGCACCARRALLSAWPLAATAANGHIRARVHV